MGVTLHGISRKSRNEHKYPKTHKTRQAIEAIVTS
jgi:hypothetical protein